MSQQILVVCTGNICRSPVGQALLAEALRERGDTTVLSAGTRAVVGSPPAPQSQEFLAPRLKHEFSHVGTALDRPLAESADLILTMTAEHRNLTARIAPRTIRRTFTLREASIIATSEQAGDLTQSENLRELAREMSRMRSLTQGSEIDIEDPMGGSPEDYAHSFGQVEECVRLITPILQSLPLER